MSEVARTLGPAAAVVRVTEELDLATTPALRTRIEQALRARPQTLAVDLSPCPFAGVDAIETLVEMTARARCQGTTLLLVGLPAIVRRAIFVLGRDGELYVGDAPAPRRTCERDHVN